MCSSLCHTHVFRNGSVSIGVCWHLSSLDCLHWQLRSRGPNLENAKGSRIGHIVWNAWPQNLRNVCPESRENLSLSPGHLILSASPKGHHSSSPPFTGEERVSGVIGLCHENPWGRANGLPCPVTKQFLLHCAPVSSASSVSPAVLMVELCDVTAIPSSACKHTALFETCFDSSVGVARTSLAGEF